MLSIILEEFIEECGSAYKAAKKLGISEPRLSYLRRNGQQLRNHVALLCKIRKLMGKSWSKFGKELEDESC